MRIAVSVTKRNTVECMALIPHGDFADNQPGQLWIGGHNAHGMHWLARQIDLPC